MERYLVTFTSSLTYSVIIEADNEVLANDIAFNCGKDEMFCEETCLDMVALENISGDDSFDLPILKQTELGYCVL